MKEFSKIVGIVQASNEWPLIALSIAHALTYHVDEVFVLNHASTDVSLEGLKNISAIWSGRVHILNCYDNNYWQEASTNILIEICQSASPDWIYVFDADEFLLTRENRPLKEILREIDPKYTAIRYEVQNWISTLDFDENQLDDYRKLHFRSVPNMFLNVRADLIVDEIENGNWNFYDLPFPSKVIFKNEVNNWLVAGAHSIKDMSSTDVFHCDVSEMCAAHFPFLSRKRLQDKLKHGEKLIRGGFPITHGWQSQLIYRLWEKGSLSQFWENHSLVDCNEFVVNNTTAPSFIEDDSFVKAIEPVLSILLHKCDEESFRNVERQDLLITDMEDTQIPFRIAMSTTRKCQLIANKYAAECASLVAKRDSLLAECDSLLAERDSLLVERDSMLNSRSWRYTRFLSRIFSMFRRYF